MKTSSKKSFVIQAFVFEKIGFENLSSYFEGFLYTRMFSY